MRNKLLLRIIGALSSSLIVVAVFAPWISAVGYSESLWSLNQNALYLPIMIMAFGVLGILLFALNIKTEFVYMSTGAVLFQVIVESINMINQGKFSLFGLGYYLLLAGGILTGIMTFIVSLKPKKVKEDMMVEDKNLGINKIDNLYNNDNAENVLTPIDIPIEPIKPVDMVEEAQVNHLEPPVQQTNINTENNQIRNDYVGVNMVQNYGFNNQSIQPNNNLNPQPVEQRVNMNYGMINQNIEPINNLGGQVQPAINNPRPEFDVQSVNSNIGVQNQTPVNPVVQNQTPVNPVVQDFVKTFNTEQKTEVVPPVNRDMDIAPSINQNLNNNSNVDIFGQQINK